MKIFNKKQLMVVAFVLIILTISMPKVNADTTTNTEENELTNLLSENNNENNEGTNDGENNGEVENTINNETINNNEGSETETENSSNSVAIVPETNTTLNNSSSLASSSVMNTNSNMTLTSSSATTALPEAVDGKITITESGEYKLDSNISANIVIQEGVTATIDLNGYTLTNSINNHTISNYGTLIIKNGTVDNNNGWKAAIANFPNAICTIESGTYTRSRENGTGSNTYYVINNLGTMTINGAQVYTGESYSYSALIHNGFYGDNGINDMYTRATGTPTLTINGGNFKNGRYTIKNDDYSKCIINGGNFYNKNENVIINYNDLEINGGEFVYEGTKYLLWNYGYNDAPADDSKTTITGGYFKSSANVIVMSGNEPKIDISGGFFMSTKNDASRGAVISASNMSQININGGYYNRDVYANGNTTNNHGNDYVETGYYAVPIGKIPTGVFPTAGTTYNDGDDWYWVTDKLELTLTSGDKEKTKGENDPEYPDVEVIGFQPTNIDGIIVNNTDTLENTFEYVNITSREAGEDVSQTGYKYNVDYQLKDYGTATASAGMINEKTSYFYKNVYALSDNLGVLRILPIIYDVEVETAENGTVTSNVSSSEAGDIVKVSVSVNPGYRLARLRVFDSMGNSITVNDDYTFVMPESNVTILAKIVKEEISAEDEEKQEQEEAATASTSVKANTNTINPQTGDNIMMLVVVLVISILGVIKINTIKYDE